MKVEILIDFVSIRVMKMTVDDPSTCELAAARPREMLRAMLLCEAGM